MASSQGGGFSNTAFQEALQRAKQLAAKITQQATGKRPAEDVIAPEPKRTAAAINDPIGAQLAAMKHQTLTRPSKNAAYINGLLINGEKTLDIMIPGSKVGYVIGKGGEMIRNLQERAGVKMTVFQESNEATDHEKQLRIIGDPDKVDYAKQLVTDLLTEKEIETIRLKTGPGPRDRSSTNDYGTLRPGSVEVPVPPQYIGLVIGKGGESIRRIQQETQCKVQFDTTKSDANGNKVCSISGPPDAVSRAVDMVKEIIENAVVRANPMHGRKPRDGDEVRMPIPAYRTGAVIGRGGETIRTIKQQSGCDIELEKNTKGGNSDEKYFIIRGPPEKISVAQQLILERVNGTNSSSTPPTSTPSGMSYNELQQWTNYYQQNDTTPSSDDSKSQDNNAAAWAAYYAQYYASGQQQNAVPGSSNGASASSAPTSESASAPPDHQQQSSDYTAQWAEYYRAYGMHKEAEMIEQMAKKQGGDEEKKSSEKCNNPIAPPVAYPGYNYANYNPQNQERQ